MCGIAGIINLAGGVAPQRTTLERMIGALAHRGPDGFGYYNDENVGLAHARLSIIDISGGSQPIHNEDSTVWVVFNGEIFNYIELREELERAGHRFYTHSDTEVIVHLYEQHGLSFVDHLNGQFAIALWDKTRRRLVLTRDRTGIRPLFYTRSGGRFLFGSEVKALFADPAVPRRFSMDGLSEVFTYWTTLAPATVFEGIEQLPPGHLMIVERGQIETRCYWDWSFPAGKALRRPEGEVAREVRELIVDAVRLQLRSDVPVGAYLSGGLDSSIITAAIKNFTDVPLRTFSITFEDDEFDESSYQQELVRHLGTNHTSVRCTRADIAAAFPRAVWYTESPVLRTAPTPLMLLSQRVREEGYKVVLTGEGADEVFAGYDIYKEAKVRRFWARAPQSKLRPRILERLYPYLKHSPVAGRAFAQSFFGEGMAHADKPWFAHMPRFTTTRRIWQFLSRDVRAALGDRDPYAAIEKTLPPGIGDWEPLSRDQYVEAHTLLSGYLLSSQGDRMAMASSIEGRFPFLDHRLIELANSLPPHYKIRGLNEKYILKRAMGDLLPASIVKRTKQPYRAPDSQSFFVDGKPVDYVAESFSESRLRECGFLDPVASRKLFEKCRSGRAIGFGDNMAFVGILSALLVDEMFLRGRVAPPAETVLQSRPAISSRA